MNEGFWKTTKMVGIWILIHLVILLAYIPAHIAWGNPLDKAEGYYAFGIIIGVIGGWIMRGKSIFFAVLPTLVARAEGMVVNTYAYNAFTEATRISVSQSRPAYWEVDIVSGRYGAQNESMIALVCCLMVMVSVRLIVRRLRGKDAQTDEGILKSSNETDQ